MSPKNTGRGTVPDRGPFLATKEQGGNFGATVARVARPRGEVSSEQAARLTQAAQELTDAQNYYRVVVVTTLAEGASFAEVSKATGLSTNTLQRWKREARGVTP